MILMRLKIISTCIDDDHDAAPPSVLLHNWHLPCHRRRLEHMTTFCSSWASGHLSFWVSEHFSIWASDSEHPIMKQICCGRVPPFSWGSATDPELNMLMVRFGNKPTKLLTESRVYIWASAADLERNLSMIWQSDQQSIWVLTIWSANHLTIWSAKHLSIWSAKHLILMPICFQNSPPCNSLNHFCTPWRFWGHTEMHTLSFVYNYTVHDMTMR